MDTDVRVNYLKRMTRTIPDFPKKGIMFRDITSIIQDPVGMLFSGILLVDKLKSHKTNKFVGIESRGFIFAGQLSGLVGGGVVLARKKGKLPHTTVGKSYTLEYGTETIELHKDSIIFGEKVVVVDDLLATGGTALATCELIEEVGGIVDQVIFLIELPELKGREKLRNYEVSSVITFEGE